MASLCRVSLLTRRMMGFAAPRASMAETMEMTENWRLAASSRPVAVYRMMRNRFSPPEQKADAALEFVVILGGPLEVGHQEQIDAEQAGAHAGEEGHQIADGRVVLPAGADGTQVSGGHFQAQEQHHDAQHRFDDPGHGEPQQPGAGDHTGQQNDQQGQDLPQVQQLPALPGNIGIDAEIRHQAAGGDEGVVQTHGQQGRGDQWVAEADDPFDDVAEKLDQENKQRNVPCEFHRCASCAEYVDRREKTDK